MTHSLYIQIPQWPMHLRYIISLCFTPSCEFRKEDKAGLLLAMRLALHSGHTNSGLGAQQLPLLCLKVEQPFWWPTLYA